MGVAADALESDGARRKCGEDETLAEIGSFGISLGRWAGDGHHDGRGMEGKSVGDGDAETVTPPPSSGRPSASGSGVHIVDRIRKTLQVARYD